MPQAIKSNLYASKFRQFYKRKIVNKKQTCIHFSEYKTKTIASASKCKMKKVPIIYKLIKTQRSDIFRLHIRGFDYSK